MVTMLWNGWRNSRSATAKSRMWGGSYAGFDQWATAKELPPHLATIVPAAAAHPPLDYPSYLNVGQTYDVRWFTFTSGKRQPGKSFRRSKNSGAQNFSTPTSNTFPSRPWILSSVIRR